MGKYVNFTLIKNKEENLITNQNTVKAIAGLNVENKKKDILIQSMAQTIATLNIEIQQLKGGN